MALCISIPLALLGGCQLDQVDPFKSAVTDSLDHFYQGERLLRQQDFEAAREEYLMSVAISPRPIAYYRLAEISIALGRIEEAQEYLDQALQLNPRYERARMIQQELDGRRITAPPMRVEPDPIAPLIPDVLSPSAPLIPEAPTPTVVITPSTPTPVPPTVTPAPPTPTPPVDTVEPVEGIDIDSSLPVPVMDEAIVEAPPLDVEGEALLRQIEEAEAAGNWSQASTMAMQLLQRHPTHPTVLYHMGYASYHLGLYEEAEKHFQRAVQADPRNASAWNDLGVTLELLGRSTEASVAYQNAVDLGASPDAYFNLAILKEKQGLYREAIPLYERYLEFDSSSPFADRAREQIIRLRRYVY